MPISLKQNIEPKGILGVWSVQEDIAYFHDRLSPSYEEVVILSNLSERKAKEWYASRYLLHFISGRTERIPIAKSESGKPYLLESDWNISLSHSKDLVAVLASPSPIGVDIQYFVDKITRIAPKFVHPEEYDLIDMSKESLMYHFIWGAKESLFKLYGKGSVDFKKHLRITTLQHAESTIVGKGEIRKNDFSGEFRLVAKIFDEYILVYAI